MKTLSQQLKQVFNALEFANVSNLNELNEKLSRHEFGPAEVTGSQQRQPVRSSVENAKSVAAPSL